MAASEISDNSWSQYDDPYNYGAAHSYGLNETAGVSGTLYDLSFSACSFDADVTLTSYLRGDQAADKILEMGGDLSGAPRNGIVDSDLSNKRTAPIPLPLSCLTPSISALTLWNPETM